MRSGASDATAFIAFVPALVFEIELFSALLERLPKLGAFLTERRQFFPDALSFRHEPSNFGLDGFQTNPLLGFASR